MKFELIAIEDNTAHISEIKGLEKAKAKILEETANELETLSRENLLKIFSVLKSYYEEYCEIIGKKIPCNYGLSATTYGSELRTVGNSIIFYRVRKGVMEPVIKATFSSDKIVLVQNDIPSAVHLMKCWQDIKNQMQRKILEAATERVDRLRNEVKVALDSIATVRNFEL